MDPEEILPEEIWASEIMKNLSLRDILSLEEINKTFKKFSESEKGELMWKQKLQNKFPGADEFKTEGMTSREMYIRIARGFGLLQIDFVNDNNTEFETFPNHLFNLPDGNTIPINPDNDRGIAKYFVDWAVTLSRYPPFIASDRVNDDTDLVNVNHIMYGLLMNYDDYEMLDWFLDTYNVTSDDFLAYVTEDQDLEAIPLNKLKYIFSKVSDSSEFKRGLAYYLFIEGDEEEGHGDWFYSLSPKLQKFFQEYYDSLE